MQHEEDTARQLHFVQPQPQPRDTSPTLRRQLSVSYHQEIKPYTQNPTTFHTSTSVTHEDYQKPHVVPPPPQQPLPPPQAAAQSLPFDASTTYSSDFRKHPIEPPPALPQAAAASESSERDRRIFEGETIHRSEYKRWPIEAPPPTEPRAVPEYTPNPARFEGESSYHSEFKRHELPPASSELPPTGPPAHVPNPARFQGETIYRSEYKRWPIEAQPPAAAHAPPEYQPNALPFDDQTSHKAEYKAWQLQPMLTPSVAPVPTYESSPLKFDGTTTHRHDFKRMPLPPKVPLALGVQVAGASFFELIPRGATPPAMGHAVFTTCEDDQASVSIKVLGSDGEGLYTLGRFELSGISPSRAGVPQIVVTLSIPEVDVLQVSAVDRLGTAGSKHLEIRDELSTPSGQRYPLAQGHAP